MVKNNKGFVITEVLILSTVIMGVLVFMYMQFKAINRGYQYSFKYDTPEGMYLANNIVNYINDGNYDKLVEQVSSSPKGYIDITECNVNNSNLISYCSSLFQKEKIEKIIFTEEDLTKIKQNINDFDNEFRNYLNQIKVTKEKNDYRIIVKFQNKMFASMRFNKGNAYVEDGLIAYLDGINNTGNGHLSDTSIWKDLSNHGNDATLYNNPVWSNNSLTFDGQTNYGLLNNTINIEFTNGATIEARVKVLSFVGHSVDNSIEFFSNWEGAGIGIKMKSDQTFRAGFYDTGWKTLQDTKPSNLNEYYTLTLTYNNSVHSLYINGKLVATDTYNNSGIIKVINVPFAIGGNPKRWGVMDAYANVEFQNVLIYDRALTENEVLRNYQADLARY